jgi:hypothetical protein
MSNELINWEEKMREQAVAVARQERPSTNKISFKSGVMTYMDNIIKDNTLECVILAATEEHVWYETKWKANEYSPPSCFAIGIPGDELFPHEVVPDAPATSCRECPNWQWGSDPEGGRGKACKERRRIAVIPNDDFSTSEMALMSLPTMSIKNWSNHVNEVAAILQRPTWGVISRVRLVPDVKSQFKVVFGTVRPLESDELSQVHPRIAMAEALVNTPYEMSIPEEEAQAPSKKEKY